MIFHLYPWRLFTVQWVHCVWAILIHCAIHFGFSSLAALNVEQISKKETKQSLDESDDSELDSDDDLDPYDTRTDVTTDKVKKPVYLRQCMEGKIKVCTY